MEKVTLWQKLKRWGSHINIWGRRWGQQLWDCLGKGISAEFRSAKALTERMPGYRRNSHSRWAKGSNEMGQQVLLGESGFARQRRDFASILREKAKSYFWVLSRELARSDWCQKTGEWFTAVTQVQTFGEGSQTIHSSTQSASQAPWDENWADHFYSHFHRWDIVTQGGHRGSWRAQSWKVVDWGLKSCSLPWLGLRWVAGHQELLLSVRVSFQCPWGLCQCKEKTTWDYFVFWH